MNYDKPLGERTDEDLMVLMKDDDQDAFAVLYERHRRAAFAIAARTSGAGSADDVVQLAFFTIWRGRAGYEQQRGAPRGWILAIVRNRAIDALRRDSSYDRLKRAHEHAVGRGELNIARHQPDLRALEQEEARAARAALALLPESQRRALELAYFQGLTHQQIAARESAPLGTVKSRLRLGLKKLHRQLAEAPISSASSS